MFIVIIEVCHDSTGLDTNDCLFLPHKASREAIRSFASCASKEHRKCGRGKIDKPVGVQYPAFDFSELLSVLSILA